MVNVERRSNIRPGTGSIPETGDMKRPRRRPPARIEGVHLHHARILAEADGDEAGHHRLVQGAADGCGEIGLCDALQQDLLADPIFIGSVEISFPDHMTARDRPIRLNYVCQKLFELSHRMLLLRPTTCVVVGVC
jgi:hypothetical protein